MKSITEMRRKESKGEKDSRWQDKEVRLSGFGVKALVPFYNLDASFFDKYVEHLCTERRGHNGKKEKLPCRYVA